jgi:hypothetical protein
VFHAWGKQVDDKGLGMATALGLGFGGFLKRIGGEWVRWGLPLVMSGIIGAFVGTWNLARVSAQEEAARAYALSEIQRDVKQVLVEQANDRARIKDLETKQSNGELGGERLKATMEALMRSVDRLERRLDGERRSPAFGTQ